jgi:hypothetical protein
MNARVDDYTDFDTIGPWRVQVFQGVAPKPANLITRSRSYLPIAG